MNHEIPPTLRQPPPFKVVEDKDEEEKAPETVKDEAPPTIRTGEPSLLEDEDLAPPTERAA